jgi:hypothetical protein
MARGNFPAKLKLLRAAMRMQSTTQSTGMCFHRAAAMALDLPAAQVVFGIFRAATPEEQLTIPNASTVPFIHAWVEWGGKAFAPTTIEREGGLFAMIPEGYYRVNGARSIKRLKRAALVRIARETGLLQHLTKNRDLKGSFIKAMLDEVGMPFTVSDDGGIVPAEEENA